MSRLRLLGEGDGGAAHSHAEADISDGAILARLAANEAISGAWDFAAGKIRLAQGSDANKPATGNSEGHVYWATDTDKLYVWDGAAWKAASGGDGIGTVPWTQGLSGEPASGSYTDMRLEAGYVSVNVGANGTASVVFTYRQAFSQTPKVIVGLRTGVQNSWVRGMTAGNESTTGVAIDFRNESGVAQDCSAHLLVIGR